MPNYNYVEVRLPQVTESEFLEMLAESVQTSLTSCKFNQGGTLTVLKYLGETLPPSYVTHSNAISTPKKQPAFKQDVLDVPAKQFKHEVDKATITPKFKGGAS